ncbi:hypothetical protein BD769DRAFT_1392701 [Suillus cothurnatus]|nr:hypothetical protein BD769DRAFT_1392701 [Suillus cothurnatus]
MTPILEVVILSIMSFLAAHESFMAYKLWLKSMTDEIRRLQGPEDLESWELFPSLLQEMAEWADVYKDEDKHDKSRNHTLIYKHVPEEDMTTIFPVAICLHGILEQFHVEYFGNWSGKVKDIQRAVQYINLSSGGHEAAWNATIASLNLTNDYRCVFYKRETVRESKEPRLQPEEDPGGKFYHIQDKWNVIQPLHLAELTVEGKKLPINAILLTEGDFIEVGPNWTSSSTGIGKQRQPEVQKRELDIKRITRKHNLTISAPVDEAIECVEFVHEKTSMTGQKARLDDADSHESQQMIDDTTTKDLAGTSTGDQLTVPPKCGGGASQASLSVKTVIPHPMTLLIDPSQVEEYDESLKTLKILLEYTNPKANIYALGKLLPTVTWGPYKLVNDWSKILCDPATGEPLTIWIVARKSGEAGNNNIMPLSQTLAKQSGLLLTKFLNPVLSLNKQSIDIIHTMKWQNAKNSEEMQMTRYSRRGDDNKWHSRAQYEIVTISLLHITELSEEDNQGMHPIDGLAI